MSPAERYDTIGRTYAAVRRPDPRIAHRIDAALGRAASVVNVGAGTGSYEPADRRVVAVEPSPVMIAQRPPGAAPVVRAAAEALPFADGTFDAALAVLTVHHWSDAGRGLAELRRVAGRQVVLTWDRDLARDYWLVRDYLPQIADLDRGFAVLPEVRAGLGGGQVWPVPLPHDCADGVLAAYWRRPEAYLDPVVRAGMSGLALLPDAVVAAAMARLAADLASGEWRRRNADLLDRDELDLGYRLVVA